MSHSALSSHVCDLFEVPLPLQEQVLLAPLQLHDEPVQNAAGVVGAVLVQQPLYMLCELASSLGQM